MDELVLITTYMPWVRHQLRQLFAGPLSSMMPRASLPSREQIDNRVTDYRGMPAREERVCG